MKYQLIVIDDDYIILMLIKRLVIMSELHLAPISFLNGPDCLDHISNTKDPLPVVILLDINMPNFNGWDFLESLDQFAGKVRIHVVMITSSINTADKVKALTYNNVIGYYEKPLTLDTMKAIRSIDLISDLF